MPQTHLFVEISSSEGNLHSMRLQYGWLLIPFLLALTLSACTAKEPQLPEEDLPAPRTWAETRVVEQVANPTETPTPLSSPTIEATVRPTPTAPAPAPTAGQVSTEGGALSLDFECLTPKSLMLHSAFGKTRMEALAQEILSQGLETITYRKVLEGLRRGMCPPENGLIVSLDDLGTNWLRLAFIDMVKAFTDKGLVLVVGTVTRGPQTPEIWELFKTWDALDVEVASHTMDHYILTLISDSALEEQVSDSYGIICEQLGKCPVSIILPFGEGGDDPRVVAAASEYSFLVGMQGGRSISGEGPFFVGRIPPDNDDQALTLRLLQNFFQP